MTATQDQYLQYIRPSIIGRPTSIVYGLKIHRPAVSAAAREPLLLPLHDQLDRLAALPNNWDGYDSLRPHPLAIERARQFLEEGFSNTQPLAWQSPYISASEDGEIIFEWWNGVRKLTIYVGPEQSTFIQSWGPHIVEEMKDGLLTHNWDPSLWTWLFE